MYLYPRKSSPAIVPRLLPKERNLRKFRDFCDLPSRQKGIRQAVGYGEGRVKSVFCRDLFILLKVLTTRGISVFARENFYIETSNKHGYIILYYNLLKLLYYYFVLTFNYITIKLDFYFLCISICLREFFPRSV